MVGGYIYVLVNSSMPGLLKVGKTSREPSERVAELSSATGVATPFIVAFEQWFADCDAAEDYVHTILEQKGVRQSKNREFFRAAPNEVIRVILEAANFLGGVSPETSEIIQDDDFDLLSSEEIDDDFGSSCPPAVMPWDDLLKEADRHYLGYDGYIKDAQEALKLYKDAARLGSIRAYDDIGRCYLFGNNISQDWQKAFQYFKEGAKRGNYYCYSQLAYIFDINEDTENCLKAWGLFFSKRNSGINKELEISGTFPYSCVEYIEFCLRKMIDVEYLAEMRKVGSEIVEIFESSQKSSSESNGYDGDMGRQWRKSMTLDWARENLIARSVPVSSAPSSEEQPSMPQGRVRSTENPGVSDGPERSSPFGKPRRWWWNR
jgi:hypothetical protein